MIDQDAAGRLARVLTAKLDKETLTAVIAQLLGKQDDEFAFQPRQVYRKSHFKAALGEISESMWHSLRARKKIPAGKLISPNIEIWTHEQVMDTITALAEEQEQRDMRAEAPAT